MTAYLKAEADRQREERIKAEYEAMCNAETREQKCIHRDRMYSLIAGKNFEGPTHPE